MTVCPYCGANVERQAGEVVLTCPYCGTAFTIQGVEVGEHLMGRVNYGVQQLFHTFKAWALRMPETPNDFVEKASFENYSLVFHPFWLYVVKVRVAYPGGSEEIVLNIALPASTSMIGTPIEKPKLSLAGKVYYSHKYVLSNGGKIVNPDVDPSSADQKALTLAEELAQQSVAFRFREKARLRVEGKEIVERKLVHQPIYQVTYTYNGKNYKFIADASDSRVLYAEVPVELKFRVAALICGISSLVLGSVTLLFAGDHPAFALTSLLGFLVVGAVSLSKALASTVVTKKFFAE
ncbi:MAG: zinc ribbon domain-containing protein [Thermofilum sp.]|jgi:hypothetical protein|nr:zinc ribbon domain-containing protein [Thermofilum sp.]